MKKTVKLVFKYGAIFALCGIVVVSIFVLGLFLIPSKVKFDIDKIKYSNASVQVFDSDNRIIKTNTSSGMCIKLDTLHMYTKDAFISIEDKNFYTHHGLNYKRMIIAYEKAKEYADKNGISIYNTTRGGELEVFKRVKLEDVLF